MVLIFRNEQGILVQRKELVELLENNFDLSDAGNIDIMYSSRGFGVCENSIIHIPQFILDQIENIFKQKINCSGELFMMNMLLEEIGHVCYHRTNLGSLSVERLKLFNSDIDYFKLGRVKYLLMKNISLEEQFALESISENFALFYSITKMQSFLTCSLDEEKSDELICNFASMMAIGCYQRVHERLHRLSKGDEGYSDYVSGTLMSSQVVESLVHSFGYFFAYPLLKAGYSPSDLQKINTIQEYLDLILNLDIPENFAKQCLPYTRNDIVNTYFFCLKFFNKTT